MFLELFPVLVYQNVVTDLGEMDSYKDQDNDKEEENDELGGFYRAVVRSQEEKVKEKETLNALDSSKFPTQQTRDWTQEAVRY